MDNLSNAANLAISKVDLETPSVESIQEGKEIKNQEKDIQIVAEKENPPSHPMPKAGIKEQSQEINPTASSNREELKETTIEQIRPPQVEIKSQLQKKWFTTLISLSRIQLGARNSVKEMNANLNALKPLLQCESGLVNSIRDGQTALHIAASSVSHKICKAVVELLAEQTDIDVNIVNKQEHTALYLAAFRANEAKIIEHKKGYKSAIELLLQKGAIPSEQDMQEIGSMKRKMRWLIELLKTHTEGSSAQEIAIKDLLAGIEIQL